MLVGKLYTLEESPACRAVRLTAKVLQIELELIEVKIFKGENLTPQFIKMNPAHSLPTYLDNDGTSIGDSHAIMMYLVSKYGKDDLLYPKDLTKRAAVQHLLHFHSGAVYSLLITIVLPMYMREEVGPNQRQITKAHANYEILNTFLEGRNWVAGTETPTIADFSLVTTIDSFRILVPMDDNKYPNIVPWIKRCEALPYYNVVNKKGEDSYRIILKDMLNNKHDFMEEWTK